MGRASGGDVSNAVCKKPPLDSVSRKRLNHRTTLKFLRAATPPRRKTVTLSRFEQSRREDAYQAQFAAQTEVFKRWFEEKHPEIKYGQAVLNVFLDDMGDAFLTATEDDFQYCLDTTTVGFSRRRVPTETEIKQDLIQEILDLLRSPDGTGREGKYSNFDLKQVEINMMRGNDWTVEKLTARRNEIISKQEMSKHPIEEVVKVLQNARQYTGYPQLPKTIVRPGTVRAVTLDAPYLKALDVWELKRLNRLYGIDQVNDRLAGRS
jgi:hypothetical protein